MAIVPIDYFWQFQVLLTLFSKSFSPFPHGTCVLSVFHRYLALDGIYHPIKAALPSNPTLRRPVVRCGLPTWNGGLTLHAGTFQYTLVGATTDKASIDYNSLLETKKDLQFELFPVHSQLLGESCLLSFPPLNYMLKSSG